MRSSSTNNRPKPRILNKESMPKNQTKSYETSIVASTSSSILTKGTNDG